MKVAALHQSLAKRDARRLGVADRRRRARIGERHHHVGLDRRFLGQLVAHPDARVLQLAVLEDGVRSSEIDELEHAHRVLARSLEGDAVDAVLVHDHHLARLDLAHEVGVDRVERAGLRRNHMGGLPR
jgi:hypothetical protein